MAKSKSKNKRKRKRGFPPAAEPVKQAPKPSAQPGKPQMKWGLVALFLAISIGGCYLFLYLMPKGERYGFKVEKTYPHDATAFTQGLQVDDGFLWESTGRYGESTVRKINLKTGEELDRHELPDDLFGEGMTVLGDKIYQVTWKEEKGIVYDRELNPIDEFKYEGQGWGLATNGTDLILSNGTAEIKFLDPKTFKQKRSIWAKKKGGLRAGQLNELEYYGGRIYANVYQTDLVYEIDPDNGAITKIIDLTNLWPIKDRPADGVLNGIAINPETKRFLITGKLCPKIFELSLFKLK
jgi:glutamine cyclotransferase